MTSIPRFGAVYVSQSEFPKLKPLGLNNNILGYPTKEPKALQNACEEFTQETGAAVGATTRDGGIILVTHSDGPKGKEPEGDIYQPGGTPQRRVTDYLNNRGAYYRIGNFIDLFTRTM